MASTIDANLKHLWNAFKLFLTFTSPGSHHLYFRWFTHFHLAHNVWNKSQLIQDVNNISQNPNTKIVKYMQIMIGFTWKQSICLQKYKWIRKKDKGSASFKYMSWINALMCVCVGSGGPRRWAQGCPPTNICLYYKIKFKQHTKPVAHKIANILYVARDHNFPQLHTLLDLKNYKVQTPNTKI